MITETQRSTVDLSRPPLGAGRERPRLLVVHPEGTPLFEPLQRYAEVTPFPLPSAAYTLEDAAAEDRADPELCLELARAHAGAFDCIVAECTGGFLWHTLFRLAGDRTPFVLVPRFNHVFAPSAFALLLSSQLRLPGDVVFPGSRAAARSFAHFGFACDPHYVPGVRLDTYRPLAGDRAGLRDSLGLPAAKDVLLYVGRMVDDKNVLELIEIFRRVRRERDAHLVIAYHFSRDEYLAQCRKRAREVGGIELIHRPDRETIVRYYNAADLFVSAAVSLFETFGRAPVEAMACGTPPVVAAYDGFRETVSPQSGELVPTTWKGHRKWPDVRRFAEVICAALADRSRLREMGEAGLRRARCYDETEAFNALMARIEGLAAQDAELRELPSALGLDGYPDSVAGLWRSLEGRSLRELAMDFLHRRKIPVRPPDEAVVEYYRGWFSHY